MSEKEALNRSNAQLKQQVNFQLFFKTVSTRICYKFCFLQHKNFEYLLFIAFSQMKAEEEFHSEELADGDEKLSTLTIEFSDMATAKAKVEEECQKLKAKIELLSEQVRVYFSQLF